MPGPRPKPDDRRQRANKPKKPTVSLVPAEVVSIQAAPPALDRWLPRVQAEWVDLWGHPIAQHFDRTLDEPELRIIFDLEDERERLACACRAEPLVEGSQGQPRANPLFARLGAVESELRNRRAQFGLNLKSRTDLAISFGQAKRSLEDLSRSHEDAGPGEADDDEEEDPRIVDAELVDPPSQAGRPRSRPNTRPRRVPVDRGKPGPRAG